MSFEQFITERFLDFYNKRESANFTVKEKADEKEREKPIYDFYCIDEKSKKEMAIEVKRLIPREKGHIQNINNLVHNYVEKPLKGKIKGDYFLLVKGFESPFKLNRKKRIELLDNIKEEIQSLKDPGESYDLKCCKRISIIRSNKKGSSITAWIVDLSSADDKEIVRMLDSSLKKFESEKMINIILFVELSSTARTTEIANIIEWLEKGFEPNGVKTKPRNFDLINGIYHIGIHRKTVIAQVYPLNKLYESRFFNISDFMETSKFKQWAIEYLL